MEERDVEPPKRLEGVTGHLECGHPIVCLTFKEMQLAAADHVEGVKAGAISCTKTTHGRHGLSRKDFAWPKMSHAAGPSSLPRRPH